MTNRAIRLSCGAAMFVAALVATVPAWGAEDLRALRAQAIRRAAERVATSLVRVEKFGVAEAGGEVADDAPTVALAIDDNRHFLASSLVQRQTPASIVLVAEDGRRSTAQVVATDHRRQLVLLKAAEDLGVKPIEMSSSETRVGQTVVAVGRIAGDGSIAVSSGVLSATDRLWGIALQTDARVSSVFYGGPLIDLRGQLLGILVPAVPDDMGEDITAWYDSGVAFAIPVEAVAQRLPTLLSGNDIHGGLVGIVAKSNDPYVQSAEIAAVRPRSPAARAGLQPGDIVLSIEGQPVQSHREIKQLLGSKDAGQVVSIDVRRDDARVSRSVTLAETIPPLRPQWIGITATDLELAEGAEGPRVAITGVVPGSPAAASLQVNDRIQSLDGSAVEDVASLRRRIFSADPDQPLQLTITRSSQAGEPEDLEVSLRSQDLAESLPESLPEALAYQSLDTDKWTVADLTLPDVGNKMVVLGPEKAGNQNETASPLGILLVLADPGTKDLKEVANAWSDPARQAGVIVAVIAPANDDRWQPDEIDVPGRVVASLTKRLPIDSLMVAIAGGGSGAGSSMALAVAIARPGTFLGLSVKPDVRPPAIRLRENDPSAPLQILLEGSTRDDEPSWTATLEKNGYAILRGDEEPATRLRWIRSLPRI